MTTEFKMEDNEGDAKLLRRMIKRIAKTKFAQRETDRISGRVELQYTN